MRSAILVLVILGTIPMILAKPHIGILVWSWLAYMNPHRLTWDPTYSFGFAQIIGALTIFAWLISREPKRIPLTPITVILMLFALWTGVTTFFALVPDEAFERWTFLMKVLLITFITLPLINSRERLDALIWVIVVSVGFYGVKGGVWVMLTGGQWRVFGPPESMLADNNALAQALLMTIPLMYYLYQQSRHWVLRYGLLAAMPLCLLSILSTYSRGAILALGVMVGVFWLKSRHKFVLGSLGVVTLLVGLSVMPDKWFERIESIQSYEQDWSAMDRLKMWRFGTDVALDRPLIGGGFEVFPESDLYPDYGLTICGEGAQPQDNCVLKPRSAHSVYFQILGEHGFVGFGLFMLLAAVAFATGGRIIRQVRNRPDLLWASQLAAMTQTSLAGFGAAGIFLNMAYFDLYYHVLVIIAITGLVVSRTLSETSDAPTEAAPTRAEAPSAAVLGSGPDLQVHRPQT